jgi:hypothetical protein
MGSVFNHAIRWEFTDRNPIAGAGKGPGVRVSAKCERTPDILEVQEMHLLLGVLGIREKVMAFLAWLAEAPAGVEQHKSALELYPMEHSFYFSARELRLRRKFVFRLIRASVPNHDGTCAVLPWGNDALKFAYSIGWSPRSV